MIKKPIYYLAVAIIIATVLVTYLKFEFPATSESAYIPIVLVISLLITRIFINPLPKERDKKE